MKAQRKERKETVHSRQEQAIVRCLKEWYINRIIAVLSGTGTRAGRSDYLIRDRVVGVDGCSDNAGICNGAITVVDVI